MTECHLGNLGDWRQQWDIKRKEKYLDVEDAVVPLGIFNAP